MREKDLAITAALEPVLSAEMQEPAKSPPPSAPPERLLVTDMVQTLAPA